MTCYWHWRMMQDVLADCKKLYERRLCTPFEGPITPFGAENFSVILFSPEEKVK